VKVNFTGVLLLLCCLLIPSISNAQIRLSDTTEVYRIDKFIEVFIDSTNNATIESIQDPAIQAKFKVRGNLVFGYAKPNIWLKITSTSVTNKPWYLELPAPFIEYVDFYQRKGETWYHAESGYFRKQNLREITHTGHVFSLWFEQQTNVSYLKISGTSPKTFPLYILHQNKFNDLIRWEDLGYGVFFGILFIMFIYNLFIYISLRQINYLLYIFTIFCTALIFLGASGYGGKFLWPDSPHLNFYAGRLSLPFLIFALSIFSIRFLEVKRYSRINYFVLVGLLGLSVIALILVGTGIYPVAGNNLISLATIIFIATGIVCRWRGNKAATFYIVGWSLYFIGGLFLTLRNSGFFEFNFWTTHFVEIGAAMETTFIAFALSDQFRRLKQEKEEIQLVALNAQQEARERLEVQVVKRTEQLSNANRELNVMLETVKEQNLTIEKKNEELDAFFYRISHDLKAPISSLVGLSTLARYDVKDPEALAYFEKQHEQLSRLSDMVRGLVNIIHAGEGQHPKVKIDFEKMIQGCIDSFNSLKNADKVKYIIDVPEGIMYHSEWVILNSIFQNLIENSIKYANEVDPYIRVQIREADKELIIIVEDNGLGIPEMHQSKIFDLFYRATQNSKGSGLGLYILKRSVDKLKGKIELKSEEDKGTTFIIKLPQESYTA
jgi:signal transduction histidine kinase